MITGEGEMRVGVDVGEIGLMVDFLNSVAHLTIASAAETRG